MRMVHRINLLGGNRAALYRFAASYNRALFITLSFVSLIIL